MQTWQAIYDQGREPPAPFYEKPELPQHLQLVWEAFFDLTTERHVGMGIGPIPSSMIRVHVRDELELRDDAAEHAFSLIRRMDQEYLTLNYSKASPQKPIGVSPDDAEGVKKLFAKIESSQNRKSKAKNPS